MATQFSGFVSSAPGMAEINKALQDRVNYYGDYLGDYAGVTAAALSGSDDADERFAGTQLLVNARENQLNRDFNSAEALKSFERQLYMRGTQYQDTVKDMQKAGLNVGAMFANGANPSTATGVSSASSSSVGSSGQIGSRRLQQQSNIMQFAGGLFSSALSAMTGIASIKALSKLPMWKPVSKIFDGMGNTIARLN